MPNLKPKQISWLGFFISVLLLLVLIWTQVFVNKNYQPLYLNAFDLNILKNVPVKKHENLSFDYQSPPLDIICQPDCFFQLNDQQIPAIKDQDAAARLQQLDLKFFYPKKQLIGYQSISDHPTFYVINYTPDLLQTIQLNLLDEKLSFIGFNPNTQYIKFSSTNKSTQNTQDYLYHVTKPELIKL